MRRIFLSLLGLATLCGSLSAQTLHEVVTSLSDRQRVLIQREQVRTQLVNEHEGHSDPLPDDTPINWIGVGANPSEEAVNALGVAGRTALLNQAAAEFGRIARDYLNVSPAELENAGLTGSIDFYRTGDFPPLPRATPGNHQEILRQLAQRVRALRVLLWPSVFERMTYGGVGNGREFIEYDSENNPTVVSEDDGMNPFDWHPSQLGAANIDAEETHSHFVVEDSSTAALSVYGQYYEDPSGVEEILQPLRRQSVQFNIYYPKRATVLAKATGAQGTQIDGAVRILSRSNWNPLSATGLPSRFNSANGAFVIEGGGASGDVALFNSPPDVNVVGTWVTVASGESWLGPWVSKRFVENGYELKGASLMPPSESGYSPNFTRSYEKNGIIGCRFFSLFQPVFTRGVDVTDTKPKLDSVNRVLAGNSSDGALLLHPRPSLLFGVNLGPGLNGAGDGMLSAGVMADTLENEFGYPIVRSTYNTLGRDIVPVNRFDLSYALHLAGSAADYHVVYDNNRSGRTQNLPQLGWPYPNPNAPGDTAYDSTTLFRAWDRPRLKQVVGRDLIANITYNSSHYGGYTVTLYRRPLDAPAPTAGEAVATASLPVVRTWTFSAPAAGSSAHPSAPEKLLVAGTSGEKFEIFSTHTLFNHGAGWDDWYDYSDALSVGRTTAWWWYLPGEFQWTLKASQEEQENWRKEIGVTTTDLSFNEFVSETTVGTFVGGQAAGELTSNSLDPFGDAAPSDWQVEAAGKTITATSVLTSPGDRAGRYGRLPVSLSITYDGIQPDASLAWDTNGLLSSFTQGSWKTEGTLDGNAYKLIRKYNNQALGTEWIEFTGPTKLKHYSAPEGSISSKSNSGVAWSETETGTLLTGKPGLPHKVTRSDNSGTTFDWTIAADGSGSVEVASGLLSGGSVTRGRKETTAWNKRGFTTSSKGELLLGGTLTVSDAGVPSGKFSAWGAPLEWKDNASALSTSQTFDGNRSRAASITSALGQTTTFSNFDVLGRPLTVTANGITASHTFNGLNSNANFTGSITGSLEETRDPLGRLLTSNTTWNGVDDDLNLTYGTGTLGVSRTAGPYGTHTSTLRQEDGTLDNAEGPTLAFGGVEGDALSVSGGLLVARTEIAGASGTFMETHTDAWGRVRKVITPSTSGTGSATTDIEWSKPDSTLQRVVTDGEEGTFITETDPYDSSGAVTRSGLDLNGSGSLGSYDRFTESVTRVVGGKVVTTLSITEDSGLREVLSTEWTPSSGVTVAKLNGNEETITTTPNWATKTVTTSSSKGWIRTTTLNSQGLPTGSGISGTGIPSTSLTPSWRADGLLESVSLDVGGEDFDADFNPDGTLSSLSVAGRGNILGNHTIASGMETLTVDGVTVERKLDGTEIDVGGGNAIGRNETLDTYGSGFRHTVAPSVGGATQTALNAAMVPTGKSYAAGPGESYSHAGGLPASVSLARGGALALGWSNDGAQDLLSAAWPTVASGPFTVSGITHGFSYDRAGRVKTANDPSGSRSLGYVNGRLASSVYTAGSLKGYAILPATDASGRNTGSTIKRDGTVVHSVAKAPNGVSDQVTELASGGIKVVPQRDGAGRITGFQWGNASGAFTPAVTQRWQRDAGGRILLADSNGTVAGAPTFNYAPGGGSFDALGRRLKCATAGDTWTYTYGTAGQLVSAVHPTLGTFSYAFDAVGRRTDKGAANSTDLLNRTLAWTNTQSRTLTIHAHPDARVWFNGTEIPGFDGSHQVSVASPGANGGWVAWNTLAILEGQGEGAGSPPANPLASPDAKAEKKGAVWVPPLNEALTYDAAGNRQSGAQWDFGWDARNQLVRARTKDYATAPQGWDLTFTYDAEGRRVRKQVSEYLNGAKVSEKIVTFVWDGWSLLYERHQLPSGLTTLERKYLWGPDIADGAAGGAGGLLLIREMKGATTEEFIPLYDGTGHVVALTNLAQDLLASYAYGPFGERIAATGPKAQTNPWRYATKYCDEETGLYYFGHRYYDPVTGAWLSREPLGERESVNLYSYVGNDPINKVDVRGLAKVATDGKGNLTAFGQALLLIAKDAPDEARSLLMAAQVNREMIGADVDSLVGDGSISSVEAVLRAIDTAVGNARTDGRNEWRFLSWHLPGVSRDFDNGSTHEIFTNALFAEYAPLIAARAEAASEIDQARRAESAKEMALVNSPRYKLKEIAYGTADLPMDVGAAFFSGLMATDVTTGTSITWNGWANGGGFGLQEVSPGERAFAAAMIFLPIGRAEGVVDDVARVGFRAERSFAGTALKPWAAKGTDFMAGRLGGELYDAGKLSQLEGYLGRRGFTLRVGDEFLPAGKAGGFDAVERTIALRNNPTQYEVWHELSHFRQFQRLGPEAYMNQTRAMKEQFVFDLLENSPRRWGNLNFEQQQHAIDYIYRVGGLR